MTALFGDDPKIVAGVTGSGLVYSHFWGEWTDPTKQVRTVQYATITSTSGLRVSEDCPMDWLPTVWEHYLTIREGRTPVGTHDIEYDHHGIPTFTPAPATEEQT